MHVLAREQHIQKLSLSLATGEDPWIICYVPKNYPFSARNLVKGLSFAFFKLIPSGGKKMWMNSQLINTLKLPSTRVCPPTFLLL